MKKNFKILLLYPNERLQGVAPASLALLSAFLKNDGFEVKLFETTSYLFQGQDSNDKLREKLGQVKKSNFDDYVKLRDTDPYEDFIKLVNEYKPNLIGLSIIDGTVKYGLSFIEKIKEKNIHVVAGGVGTTFNYKKILSSELVRYACIGEGEHAIVELANAIYYKTDTTNIQNIFTKDKDGNIILNSLRPPIDLNTLPIPDFDIYEDWRFYRPFMGKVYRMIQIDTDRGCPFNCTYCASPSLRNMYKENGHNNYFRIKDTDKLFEEIQFLVKKYDIEFLWISSETFMARKDEDFRIFAKRYKEEIGLPFWTSNRLDTFTPEKTKLLAEMGCKAISLGVEHGSEYFRNKILNKKLKNDTVIKSIEYLSLYKDIAPSINNMIGVPVSGTKLREYCIENNYITENEDLPASFFEESTLNMPTISKEELKGIERVMMLYILLPKSYWDDIKIAETDDEMFNKLILLVQK